jgi:hypothetical protein
MTTQDSRSVFSLRFKRPANREALRFMAQEYGETMNEIVESAVEHELALRGAALEIRLTEALAAVREYGLLRDNDRFIKSIAEGEASGQDPFRHVVAGHASHPTSTKPSPQSRDSFGIRDAFADI